MDIYWTSLFKLNSAMEGPPKSQFDLCKASGIPLDGVFSIDVYRPAGFCWETDPEQLKIFNLPTQEFELEDWQYLLSVNPDSPSGALVADAATSVSNGWDDLNGNIRNRSEVNLTEMMDFVQNSSISNNNYQPQTIRAVLQRMTTWNNHDLIGGNPFEIRSLLTPGKVSIFMLNRLPESVRYVVVSVMTKVLMRS